MLDAYELNIASFAIFDYDLLSNTQPLESFDYYIRKLMFFSVCIAVLAQLANPYLLKIGVFQH